MSAHFSPYKQLFEQRLVTTLESNFDAPEGLFEASSYAMLSSGKRLRPLLVYLLAESTGLRYDVFDAALSVECFHTASLIADDLPCMDNDDFRRNRASVHKQFGETTALLSSYGLIAKAFEQIHVASRVLSKQIGESLSAQRAQMALLLASQGAGFIGATGGQYLDLFTKTASLSTIREIHHKKTVTLFEVSFAFGWLFGGGRLDLFDMIVLLSRHFGNAFQIADDILDVSSDRKEINIALFLGKEEAYSMFCREIGAFERLLVDSDLATEGLLALSSELKQALSSALQEVSA